MNCYVCNEELRGAWPLCLDCYRDEIARGIASGSPEPPDDPLDTGDTKTSSSVADRS